MNSPKHKNGIRTLAAVAIVSTVGVFAQQSVRARELAGIARPGSETPKVAYTMNQCTDALIMVESSGNPRAYRYEPRLHEASIGLGQLLVSTAISLERRDAWLPRLGGSYQEIVRNLYKPGINRAYTKELLRELIGFYHGNADMAVAAYNSGKRTPLLAQCQYMLNNLVGSHLKTDGVVGRNTRRAAKRFQREHNLATDGILGPKTIRAIEGAWLERHGSLPEVIPQNRYTPNEVRRFRHFLKESARE